MKMYYEFSFPSQWTFEMKPIRDFIEKELWKHTNILIPFAGITRFQSKGLLKQINIIYCDIDPTVPKPCLIGNCIDYMNDWIKEGKHFDLIISDPPFTFHQAVHTYGNEKLQDITYCRKCYTQLLTDNGILIECGFNSNGMAKDFGFEKLELLVCAVGQSHNDYLIIKEKKNRRILNENQ